LSYNKHHFLEGTVSMYMKPYRLLQSMAGAAMAIAWMSGAQTTGYATSNCACTRGSAHDRRRTRLRCGSAQ
jgi:hypothetical protein